MNQQGQEERGEEQKQAEEREERGMRRDDDHKHWTIWEFRGGLVFPNLLPNCCGGGPAGLHTCSSQPVCKPPQAGLSFVRSPRRAMRMLSCWVGTGLSSARPPIPGPRAGGHALRGLAAQGHCFPLLPGTGAASPSVGSPWSQPDPAPCPTGSLTKAFLSCWCFCHRKSGQPSGSQGRPGHRSSPSGRCATGARTDLQNQDEEGWSSEEREWDCEQGVLGSRSDSALYVPLSESPSLSRDRDWPTVGLGLEHLF